MYIRDGFRRWQFIHFDCNAWPDTEVGKTHDGRTSVTVKMGRTRDGTVGDIYVKDP